jgi:adenylosuccinate synthase
MVIDPEALFEELSELENVGISWEGRVLISDRAPSRSPEPSRRGCRAGQAPEKPHRHHRQGGSELPTPTNLSGMASDWPTSPGRNSWTNTMKRTAPSSRSIGSVFFRWRWTSPRTCTPVGSRQEIPGGVFFSRGAQGALLDLDLGTYPFVSSGSSSASGAALRRGGSVHGSSTTLSVFSRRIRPASATAPFRPSSTPDAEGTLETFIPRGGAGVRCYHGTAASNRVPRPSSPSSIPARPTASTTWRSHTSMSSTSLTRSGSASPTRRTVRPSTIFRPRFRPSNGHAR